MTTPTDGELENYKSNKIYFSDYPLKELDPDPQAEIPIRKVRILEYDGDKWCKVEVIDEGIIVNLKYLYLYETEDDLMNDRHITYADVLEELYD